MKRTTILEQILSAIGNVLDLFFTSDTCLLSPEARRILSHPQDRQNYINAIDSLKQPGINKASFTLHTGEIVTMVGRN